MYKGMMPYFNDLIHVYGYDLSILWSPMKKGYPKSLKLSNLGT